jgi:hypothetical protein
VPKQHPTGGKSKLLGMSWDKGAVMVSLAAHAPGTEESDLAILLNPKRL